jgi:hypothetical protein
VVPAHKKYFTDEERLEARKRRQAKYEQSEKGQAARRRANTSPAALKRYARYRETAKYQAAQERYKATGAHIRNAEQRTEYLKAVAPERVHAIYTVNNALRDGRLRREDACELCGRTKNLVAHHYRGYARENWLNVQWLCRPCHSTAHAD